MRIILEQVGVSLRRPRGSDTKQCEAVYHSINYSVRIRSVSTATPALLIA